MWGVSYSLITEFAFGDSRRVKFAYNHNTLYILEFFSKNYMAYINQGTEGIKLAYHRPTDVTEIYAEAQYTMLLPSYRLSLAV
jgi:hypothetical protein